MPKKIQITEKDHYQGKINSPLTLIEYGDFECGFCGQAYPIVKQLQDMFKDQLLFAFRHFPLSQAHPHAKPAAETAEFAGKYHRFWEMHDLLYENQANLGEDLFLELISTLELPTDDYKHARKQGIFLPKIEEDFTSGVLNGVNGTPTFFINGKRYSGVMSLDQFVTALEQAE